MTANSYAESSWQLKMLAPLEPGVVCNDIDRMIDFYVNVIGLELVSDAETPPHLSERFGATPYGYRIVRLQAPYGERIKLVQPKKNPPMPGKRQKWIYEQQLSYLTFVIPDVKEAIEHLVKHHVTLASKEAVEVRPGLFAIYFMDPEKNYLEFVEYPDLAEYRPDLFKKE